MTLTPAYGRDYKSKKEVQAALDAGQDFIMHDMASQWDGKPCNAAQLKEAGKTSAMVRYNKLRTIQAFKL